MGSQGHSKGSKGHYPADHGGGPDAGGSGWHHAQPALHVLVVLQPSGSRQS